MARTIVPHGADRVPAGGVPSRLQPELKIQRYHRGSGWPRPRPLPPGLNPFGATANASSTGALRPQGAANRGDSHGLRERFLVPIATLERGGSIGSDLLLITEQDLQNDTELRIHGAAGFSAFWVRTPVRAPSHPRRLHDPGLPNDHACGIIPDSRRGHVRHQPDRLQRRLGRAAGADGTEGHSRS